MQLELCITGLEEARLAARYHFDRVELCSALEIGGLSPPPGMIRAVAAIEYAPEVHALIRPRGGGFVYPAEEVRLLREGIVLASGEGASGIVIGALRPDGEIDLETTAALTGLARSLDLEITFHRAFDFCRDPFRALDQLIHLGVNRLLTSGKKARAIEGVDLIRELAARAKGRVQIMAGSGVNAGNASSLKECGVDALHFSARSAREIGPGLGMGTEYEPDEEKVKTILKSLSRYP